MEASEKDVPDCVDAAGAADGVRFWDSGADSGGRI